MLYFHHLGLACRLERWSEAWAISEMP